MTERELEKIFVKEVEKLGGKAFKWISPGNTGVPDRIVIFPHRRPIFVELKTGKGKLTPVQRTQLKVLQNLGQHIYVLKGLEGLVNFFKRYEFYETAAELEKRYDL